MRTPRSALARLSIASLLMLIAGDGCRRKAPPLRTLPEPAADFPLTVRADGKDAGVAGSGLAGPAARPPDDLPDDLEQELPLSKQKLSPALRKLVDAAHRHPAVGSLEAAGCDEALVMTGAAFNRLNDLLSGKKMPAQVDDPRAEVVSCQGQETPPPDCAALAPIFARVAHPKRSFYVYSGYGKPAFAPRCAGKHDKTGKYLEGEGPGYPSAREAQ